MSLLSDPLTFEVNLVTSLTQYSLPVPRPIIGLSSTSDSSAQSIGLEWPAMPEAVDYKLYWDKGSHDNLNVLVPLIASTSGQTTFRVNYDNSDHMLGSDYILSHGGTFKFWVSYVTSDSRESSISN